MKKQLGVAFAVTLALLSTGCTADVLGRMKGFDVLQIIQSQPVLEAVMRARNIGRILAAIEALILAFVCWYRIHLGVAWLALAKDWLVGITVCAFVLTTAGTAAGLEHWIWNLGVYLGQLFHPGGGFLMERYDRTIGQTADAILTLKRSYPNWPATDSRIVEAFAWIFSFPQTAVFVAANAVGMYLMKMVMQISYAWLISFYWMLTPIVAPTAILPQTRGIFIGWLRTYLSIALWPMFFAFAERLALAIPWSAWLGVGETAADPLDLISSVMQGQIMLVIFNITFFFVYLSIPIASHMIISGAARPFRSL
jgi:hypothetical protein